MKQHPIPQNILDVEFKLFTRFTVREFAYMAIGVGFGGIWLYLFSNGTVPGFIAIPIFLVSTMIGLGLALLPVNEQNADVFLRNFITAIRKPTLRVWRNENFDEKFDWLAEQRGVKVTSGDLERDTNAIEQSSTRVIGGTAKSLPAAEFGQEETVAVLDEEEQAKLSQIEQIASAEMADGEYHPPPINTLETPLPVPQTEVVSETSTTNTTEPFAQGTQPIPHQGSQSTQEQVQVTNEVPIQEVPTSTENVGQRPPPTDQEVAVPAPTHVVSIEKSIIISKETAKKYATEVEDYSPEKGKIAMYVSDRNIAGISQALVLIKDSGGGILQALQTDPQGLLLPKKELPEGEYIVKIQHDKYEFPDVNFILEKEPLPVVNIRSLN